MDAKTIKGLPPAEYLLEGEAAIKPVKVYWSESSRPKEGKKKEAPAAGEEKNELNSSKKGGFLDFVSKVKAGGDKSSPRGGGAKGATVSKSSSKAAYVPPPPPGGAEIPAPPVNAKVKTFKVSSGPCPPPLAIPNVSQGSAPAKQEQVEEVKAAPQQPATQA